MIKFSSLAAVAALFVVGLPAFSSAQVAKSGNGYLLRVKYKAGTTRRYLVVTKISGLPAGVATSASGDMTMTGPLIETVKSVDGKVATVFASMGPFVMAGTTTVVSAGQSNTFQVDETGTVVDANAKGGIGVRYPKNPVKVGGTWTAVMALPGSMASGGTAKTTFRFNGIKTVGKKKFANISLAIPRFGLVDGGNGVALISPVDGSLIRLTLKLMIANPQGGAGMTATTDMTVAK